MVVTFTPPDLYAVEVVLPLANVVPDTGTEDLQLPTAAFPLASRERSRRMRRQATSRREGGDNLAWERNSRELGGAAFTTTFVVEIAVLRSRGPVVYEEREIRSLVYESE